MYICSGYKQRRVWRVAKRAFGNCEEKPAMRQDEDSPRHFTVLLTILRLTVTDAAAPTLSDQLGLCDVTRSPTFESRDVTNTIISYKPPPPQ